MDILYFNAPPDNSLDCDIKVDVYGLYKTGCILISTDIYTLIC